MNANVCKVYLIVPDVGFVRRYQRYKKDQREVTPTSPIVRRVRVRVEHNRVAMDVMKLAIVCLLSAERKFSL